MKAGSRRGLNTLRALLTCVLLTAISNPLPTARAESTATTEYAVKAAFLFHFAQFVEWPPEAFKDAGSPLTYCTVGDDPFHGALDQSVYSKSVGNRPLQVQHLKQWQPTSGCQVLFIAESENQRRGVELAGASQYPVLTVGQSSVQHQLGGSGKSPVENQRQAVGAS